MTAYEAFLDRVLKAIGHGKIDKAPSRVEENIHACSQNPDTNSARLIFTSPSAWTLLRSAIVYDRDIEALLEELDSSDIIPLASKLDKHESCSGLYRQTFHTSQRARKRRGWYRISQEYLRSLPTNYCTTSCP